MLLSSRLGLVCYLLLPSHIGWACLTAVERMRVLVGNRRHNCERPDYATAETYNASHAWLSFDARRVLLCDFLSRLKPMSVLEVGPGPGALSLLIVAHPRVQRYVAVDVNRGFLAHLEPLVTAMRPGLSTRFVEGEVTDLLHEQFDVVILSSVVHHIPDRLALFAALHARLRAGGAIWAVDPTHYALRVWKIIKKACHAGHLAREVKAVRDGRFSTHAMCSLGEYRSVLKRTGFRLVDVRWSDYPRRAPRWRWFAQTMLIEARSELSPRQRWEQAEGQRQGWDGLERS